MKLPLTLAICLLASTVAGLAATAKPDAVVALDGSGNYTSVQAAVSAAPQNLRESARWTILIKPGVYRERVYIQRERGQLVLLGQDAAATTIAYNLNANTPGPDGKPLGTFSTPTVQIDGDRVTMENLTVANTAGNTGQALALRADGDRLVFRHCRFLGWQDTILANRGRDYFEDCYIEGHVDFIFGGATAFFSRCEIHCLSKGYITAASTPEDQPYGFVFADCRITAEPGVKTYLGRPWRPFARVVFLRTEMSAAIRPEGWHNWSKPDAEHTSFYAEFASTGPGADATRRAPWSHALTAADAASYSPAHIFAQPSPWNPAP